MNISPGKKGFPLCYRLGSVYCRREENLRFCHQEVSFTTLTRASLQLRACSVLRGLVTLSLLVMRERWVKLVASEDLCTYGKHVQHIKLTQNEPSLKT